MKCVKMTLIMLFKVLLITSPMGCNGTQENNQTKTSRTQPLCLDQFSKVLCCNISHNLYSVTVLTLCLI